ncbi:aspartate kinase [Alicyclobacillus tolerans]|uniref:aspartate kinase n=1 Tax=Alicyclobacillus tolerans TaxID=90970 RepID=UPI001F00BB04|nr:aspartate kinase [Alicyclobacillus tolerans]MCF8568519.1 aspartate kinase [Alicyclobacillus tolerans]
MRIIVQKFGGTSVDGERSRSKCMEHVKREIKNGYQVVVVVSAMGRKGEPYATDTLLSVVESTYLSNREKDLLLSTGELISASVFSSYLCKNGIATTVLTGGQAGIVTDDQFGEAKVLSVNPQRILEELKSGNVVIVTGFQGQTVTGETTTLGRGGSDTSATALGVALNAEFVDIFTDVEGVMTADPRIVKEAQLLKSVTYHEVCNLAYLGAKVIHPRAVEIAQQKNIPIRIRSTFSESMGTVITNKTETNHNVFKERLITGITQTPNLAQIKIMQDSRDVQAEVFRAMEQQGISVDFVNVNESEVVYTVSEEMAENAMRVLAKMQLRPEIKRNCAKVSVVGGGIAEVPGVIAQVVATLAKENITILQAADSHTTIWVLVEGEQMGKAVCALHKEFGLQRAVDYLEFRKLRQKVL